jgi:hypothetical protein
LGVSVISRSFDSKDTKTYARSFIKPFAQEGKLRKLLKARGRYWKIDGKMYVYIPASVANDSQFPLTGDKGNATVRIDGKHIVIEKTP